MRIHLAAATVVTALTLSLACAETNSPNPIAADALPDIAEVDKMSSSAFEKLVKRMLESQGYWVGILREFNDYGVDLIAKKDKDRIAVQVERSEKKIERKAISDAVAGMKHYRSNKSMVVTNSEFTEDAREFARGTDCILLDRKVLLEWLTTPMNTSASVQPEETAK